MGVGVARAKLLLFGEHAAVYGHPAVGLCLPWRLTVDHEPGPGWSAPGLGEHTDAVLALARRIEALAEAEGLVVPPPGRLTVRTAIPLASGFGSSGALCAALVQAFWPGLPLATMDRLAWLAEGQFHGTPSGIDTALALREGWWTLDPSTRPVTASPLPDPGLVLVAGAVVRQGHTKGLVAGLAERRADPRVRGRLDELGVLSTRAIEALKAHRTDLWPDLVTAARVALAELGLESPDLTAVLEAGLAAGALAGKLSGAGGGGAFYLLFAHAGAARAALPAIEAALGAEHWTCQPTLVGAPEPSQSRAAVV